MSPQIPTRSLWYKMNMDERITFYPPTRIGTIVHITLMLLFSAAGIWGMWGVSTAEMAPQLLPSLALIVLFLTMVPYLFYKLYALHRSSYTLERGGITLQWGWRSEIIPINQIKWVYRATDLEIAPHPPFPRWAGSVTGIRRFQRGPEVEFMASRVKGLVVIAAGNRYYAVSPTFVDEFITTYQDLIELGTLQALPQESIQPALVLTELSQNRLPLSLILIGGLLNISLLIWTLRVIPSRETVSLGFRPGGMPREALDSVRLILFPIISSSAYLANLILGLFLFRNLDTRSLAYILWTAGLLTGLMFHLGLLFIL